MIYVWRKALSKHEGLHHGGDVLKDERQSMICIHNIINEYIDYGFTISRVILVSYIVSMCIKINLGGQLGNYNISTAKNLNIDILSYFI